jgi:tripeptidyl-peptidase-2
MNIPVNGGHNQVVEFCVSKYWDNLGSVETEYTITFHGVQPSQNELVMHGGEGIMRVDLTSRISHEDIHPEIKLKNSVQVLRPNDSQVVTLGCRDTIPVGRHTFELQLQYGFSVPKATEVTVNMSMLSDLLYESELESQLWMLFDANKRCVGFGDAYPKDWPVKLEKGEYTLKAHVRQEKRDLLDRFTDTPVLISSKLSSTLAMEVYSSHSEALVGGKKFTTETGFPGKIVTAYITPVNTDKHTKGATLGQFLQGTATFAKDEGAKRVDVYTFKYILPELPKKKDKNKDKEAKKTKTDDFEAYEESVRDTKISWLAKLPANQQQTKDLYAELIELGSVLPSVHSARLQVLLALTQENKDYKLIAETADQVIKSIDEKELLAWLGTKSDTRDNAAEVKKEMEKQKGQLLEAFAAKGDALLKMEEVKPGDLDEIYSSILKYTDPTDSKVVGFVVNYLIYNKLYAKALKFVVKQLDDKQTKDLMNQLIDIISKLGWDHAASLTKRGMAAKFPTSYQPF